MSIDAGDALVTALHEHNPWWEGGAEVFSLPPRAKSDFYHLARPEEPTSQFEDQSLLALVGRRGVGKTTLLYQFIHHRIQAGADPAGFLYLPFDADPLYQLRSDEQLRRAVRYYESRILSGLETDQPQFLMLDDVHQVTHPSKRTVQGWARPVTGLLADALDRHVIVTASAGIQIERALESVDMGADAYDIQPILPEKFRDFLFARRPSLETEDRRLSPTSIREGPGSLPRAVATGEIAPLVEELRAKHRQVEDVDRRIQARLPDYLAMGGTISLGQETPEEGDEVSNDLYTTLRTEVREALYQDVPGFESIQTIADLERLCALAARNRGVEPFRYQALAELFDVDRRTITDSYLPALGELYLLTAATEYDNSRPRSVRLYLRDTGLVTAFGSDDAAAIRKDLDREAQLARGAAFDHTMRFAYGIEATQGGGESPTVDYWEGRDGLVDFIFEVDGTPVPIALAYRSRDRDPALAGLEEFRDSFETPLGLVLAGDTVAGDTPIETLSDGIVQLPYWLYLALC